ncbi:MAG: hypothetical protein B6D37_08425 [Sphingobacteriales bacterium UTBCD1]|jgi:hypothetical protein|nr:MAG: hypothetical protein B6D37_08425 [Sphingobacteriales bacterium UTBCD1]
MRRLLIIAVAAFTFNFSGAQSLKTPAPSPTQTVKQDFGLSSIELSYSRPGVKGRKIFGDLVPYGEVWRTGANAATTLTFGSDVTIGGKKIPAGKYGLLTIPGQNEWTVIITKQTDVTSPAAYKQDQDVVRVTAKPVNLNNKVESFTIQFSNVRPSVCDLKLMWDNTGVSFPISTDVDAAVMKQIDDLLIKDNRPYYNAAMYYMDNGKDLNQALVWFNKAVEQQPKSFFVVYQQANCLAKLGKKAEAKAAAEKSLALSKEAKNDDYVRLNEKLLAELK